MNKVALIIIYNHQYNKNIEILEQIYKDRFSNIYHLVPFYKGTKPNVISVYENSYYFQGYVAQGFKSYFNKDYAHYFFIADDLILNPLINERNYFEHLKLNQNTCFIPEFISLHERKDWWARVGEAFKYKINAPGVEAMEQLPDFKTALEAFKRFGLEIKPLSFDQIWKKPNSIRDIVRIMARDRNYLFRKIRSKLLRQHYSLSYPIVGSYSDIFVIESGIIKQFCHYCGVFASTRLFVEIGLPTALVLSAQAIVSEKDLKLQGKALWTKDDCTILDIYEHDLNKLLNNFPDNHLYIHPIKLSKWSYQS